ncbi:LacI family DNA-binding transcriptional regulator [Parvularcula dongshanensis]|uniref:DNA-binding LacI/PurR family transcriptional regulator n=1 Tax=Parvularcula dongshanensis TaxID=1173995 RepID=A0A840I8A0_9PROT|nr:substrate-binding domain-containing protein [Parvularcula dongshanensis]MBB4660180.1 DNA-binding LacI/PurR family transcriptional regulator [Parvularcula dongshanensis]
MRPPERQEAEEERQPATMSQIARRLKVSESTVSRALAGSPLVKAETREKVEALARELGFSVNLNAQRLKRRRSQTIEVVIPVEEYGRQHMSDPFFLDMIGALADALTDAGYDMLLSKRTPWAVDAEGRPRPNPLLSGRADGVIIIGQGRDQSQLRAFAAQHRQVVVWGDPEVAGDYLLVGVDNRAGGRTATEHLLSRSRRRLAFLGDPKEPEISQRCEGYKDALRAAGMPVEADLIVPARFDAVYALETITAFLGKADPIDGIVAATDVIAMTAITALQQAGLSVPGDVAVTGYDDIHSARSASPPLTTITQRIAEGGQALVATLLGAIEGGPARSRVIEPELIVRVSSG